MLDKEGIGKCESLGMKKCEAGYMYIRVLHLLLFCVSQSDLAFKGLNDKLHSVRRFKYENQDRIEE